MFGNFQKRVTTWFGRLKIDGGKLGGTADQSALEITQDWNTTGNPTLIKANATTGTAGASAKLLDLQVNGSTKVSVSNTGTITAPIYAFSINQKIDSDVYKCRWFASNTGILAFAVGHYGGHPTGGAYIGTDLRFGGLSDYSRISARLYGETHALAQRDETNAQESRLYATYTSATDYQRLSTKTIKEALTATAGATKTSTITIPAYSQLIGVTTRVTTALGTTNGTTGYQVGDGTDPDLWGAITGTAIGTTSDHNNFTAIGALGPSATARTITLTAVGGNFDNTGVIEVCAFYIQVEAD